MERADGRVGSSSESRTNELTLSKNSHAPSVGTIEMTTLVVGLEGIESKAPVVATVAGSSTIVSVSGPIGTLDTMAGDNMPVFIKGKIEYALQGCAVVAIEGVLIAVSWRCF